MNAQENLIDQLESVLASKDLSKRADILRRVTDLFIHGSGTFSDDQIELFDDVMGMLVGQIELAARAAFGSRLAQVSDAPARVIRTLAFDDAIEVAAPVLKHSARLDDAALVETARTKSQGHLLAISSRSTLAEAVTDILVDRGNHQVAASTACNRGARFSTSGLSTLVKRAQDNGELALSVWSRPDIPRGDLMKLFAQASEIVRLKLEAADPQRVALIRAAVADASDRIQATVRAGSSEYERALIHVRSLYSLGQLDEARLAGFVREGNFDRTAVALSLMSNLPIGAIERALARSEPDQLLVLAKAIDLSWETTKAILTLQAGRGGLAKEWLDRCFASFFKLQPKTARTALQFYRLRERASKDTPVSS
ncbi:Uncharacterized conserved protein, DUF2336 family [Bradyrhizobium lablabi]|uniref:Uncharacterized conserved protein, DUF2336 family n=1 Tax=Bradyrhizobium lablabi TaxID=722472 RepID=A0A1M6NYA6_9BRAD|nr:DUF2336 domain-containing protein [Bradyrhizobium lablabi]SHK00666.1 Uncharacterized conserved protein, DUF2336 family [Bradyrhizobium lablabi]